MVCDATNDKAVQILRERKHRKDKPFAIMAGSIDIVEDFAVVSDGDLDALSAMARPIVLLEKNDNFHASISELVAPNNYLIGCYVTVCTYPSCVSTTGCEMGL